MKFILRVIVTETLVGHWYGMGQINMAHVTIHDQKISANCLPRVGENIHFPDTSIGLPSISRVGYEIEGREVRPVVVIEKKIALPIDNSKPNAGWNEAHEKLEKLFISQGFSKVHSNSGEKLLTPQKFGFC